MSSFNHIEKLIALVKSPRVRIWEYPYADRPNFFYWLIPEDDKNSVGRPCYTMEQLIDEAYAHIDPLVGGLDEISEYKP